MITRPRGYTDILTQHLWSYRAAAFSNQDELFDERRSRLPNLPVFTEEAYHRNVIVPDDPALAAEVLKLVPREKRNKWFRSMKSSQALALSVFGNLKVLNRTRCLSVVAADDDSVPAFGRGPIEPSNLELEHDVSSMNEVQSNECRFARLGSNGHSIGRTSGLRSASSYPTDPTRTMSSFFTMPQNIRRSSKKARPPNICFSVMLVRTPRMWRILWASASSYATAARLPLARLDVALQARKESLDPRVPLPSHHKQVEQDSERSPFQTVVHSLTDDGP